jgi:hypothetical protein
VTALSKSVQDAEELMDSKDAKSKRYWMAHNWASSYYGACLIMYEETGQEKCAFRFSSAAHIICQTLEGFCCCRLCPSLSIVQTVFELCFRYKEELQRFAEAHLSGTHGVKTTPKGLTFVDEWGSLRHAAGVAGVLAGYARALRAEGQDAEASLIMAFAERQVNPSVVSMRFHCNLLALTCCYNVMKANSPGLHVLVHAISANRSLLHISTQETVFFCRGLL